MSNDYFSQRMEGFLRSRLFEESLKEEKAFLPSITVSRQMGAGFERIKRPLVEYLDEADEFDGESWALFDQSLVGQIIQDNRLDSSVEPYLVEDTKFPLLEALEEILNLHPSDWTLFNYTANTIRKLCRSGHAIVVGRAGNFVTADLKNTFHLRVVGSLEKRIEEIDRRMECGKGRAEALINETDKARAKFVKRYVGADIADPKYYDLVINTDTLSDELIVKMISESLLEWAYEKEKAAAIR